ncbi:copper resistance CopC/CopD family protein [Myceligenerans pegani]|uniref:Copper resistance protein CopC n=1 Tax=Myceligenerans pegani TaxID=2776917 RepID=A0ABR9MW89_9MICO|nr:FixH family protein [Myceligenerans sp. TRM 65318]MBE1875659.1 copper resistance protein CopC [Myceligenerans sp. TRM 65318]MBE3017930.1 copper resistance protein CopC [Myceligenerans sp. TRM 65318]
MPRPRSWCRAPAALVGTVAGLLAILAGGPAAAHAVLVGTDPQDGAVLDVPPDEVTITFNEPVQVVAESTTVLAADGSPVAATATAVDHTVVITPDVPLDAGTYVVSWRVISLDTHPVAGAFSFSVGAPSDTSVDVQVPEPTTALVAARAIDQAAVYAGTFLVAGLVVFELLVLHVTPGAAPVLRRRIQRVRGSALAVAGVALAAAVPLTAAWQAGGGLDAVADPATWVAGITSDTAVAGALGLAGLIVATLAAPRAGRETRAAWPAGLALGASVLALGALLLVGHTRTFGPTWLVLTSDVLHVSAGAAWLGGVVGLALVLAPSAGLEPRRAAVTVARFSALGAWLVLALALTGVTLGWRILGTVDALVNTSYGQTLLVKAGLALCVVAIAAWNRYRLVPAAAVAERGPAAAGSPGGVARRRLGRTVAAEAAILGLVLAATGVLVSNSPVTAASAGAEDAAPEAVDVTEELGEGTLQARVTPGRVGVNSLEVVLLNPDGAPVEPVAPPELTTTLADPAIGPFTHPLTETGPGTYEATLDLTMPGSWTVTLSVRTSKYENPIVDIPVEVTS